MEKYMELDKYDKHILLKGQKKIWDNLYLDPDYCKPRETKAAKLAVDYFEDNFFDNILELGAGQGRDSRYFMENHMELAVIDYSERGIDNIINKAKSMDFRGLKSYVLDITEGLPFRENSFDMIFANELYSMAFTDLELERINQELNRVLVAGGYSVFTVHSEFDKCYAKGKQIYKDIYEVDGVIYHFFKEEKIRALVDKSSMNIVELKRYEEDGRDLYFVVLEKSKFL